MKEETKIFLKYFQKAKSLYFDLFLRRLKTTSVLRFKPGLYQFSGRTFRCGPEIELRQK